MSLRILRRNEPPWEVAGGQGCGWLFDDRDFWAEECAPILVTGGNESARSFFLAKDLAGSVQPVGAVVVLFSPESPGGILEALGEALRALFPEVGLEAPKGTELMQWAAAVDRATKRSRVDLKRRLLMVEGFEAVWKGGEAEERARFAEALCCVARQRSMAVVVSLGEDWLDECAALPGFGHACRRMDYLVPIVCRQRERDLGLGTDAEPPLRWLPRTEAPSAERWELGFWLDWRVWVPAAGVVALLLLLVQIFRPSLPAGQASVQAEARRGKGGPPFIPKSGAAQGDLVQSAGRHGMVSAAYRFVPDAPRASASPAGPASRTISSPPVPDSGLIPVHGLPAQAEKSRPGER